MYNAIPTGFNVRDNERGGVLLDWPVYRSKVFSDRVIYRVEGRVRDSSASPAEYSVLYEGLDTRANLYPGGRALAAPAAARVGSAGAAAAGRRARAARWAAH